MSPRAKRQPGHLPAGKGGGYPPRASRFFVIKNPPEKLYIFLNLIFVLILFLSEDASPTPSSPPRVCAAHPSRDTEGPTCMYVAAQSPRGGIHLDKENTIRNLRWNASLAFISVALWQRSHSREVPPAVGGDSEGVHTPLPSRIMRAGIVLSQESAQQ